jgi:hypothetical protein
VIDKPRSLVAGDRGDLERAASGFGEPPADRLA